MHKHRENVMKPLGRISIQRPDAKHHPKLNGKNIEGWWESDHTKSNTSARMSSEREWLKEAEDFLDSLNTEQFEEFLVSCSS